MAYIRPGVAKYKPGQVAYGLSASPGATGATGPTGPQGPAGPTFATASQSLASPSGASSYTIGNGTPYAPTYPAYSWYFVNGIKRIYGVYYTISGSTLSFVAGITPPQTGDMHEIYCT